MRPTITRQTSLRMTVVLILFGNSAASIPERLQALPLQRRSRDLRSHRRCAPAPKIRTLPRNARGEGFWPNLRLPRMRHTVPRLGFQYYCLTDGRADNRISFRARLRAVSAACDSDDRPAEGPDRARTRSDHFVDRGPDYRVIHAGDAGGRQVHISTGGICRDRAPLSLINPPARAAGWRPCGKAA